MNLPLPHSLHVEKPSGDHNAGLWYDKFFSEWKPDFSGPTEATKTELDGKFKWVTVYARKSSKYGEPNALNEQYQRLQNLTIARGGHLLYFKTDGRFVTGLGREHPIENGFAWHHTLGVPYLPGASLKGVLRAWAREQDVEQADIARIFGPDDRHTTGVGGVLFFDAIPPAPVCLQADVMTPHYGPYYQDEDAKTPPADWHDPVPIPFLVVANAQTFVFALAPRRPNYPQDKQDCETVVGWLEDALTWLGAGAKTAVGYGRFKPDRTATATAVEAQRQTREKRERAAALAARVQNLSPLAQELEREIEAYQLDSDKNAFSGPPRIEDWLTRLESDSAVDAIERFSGLIDKHFPGLLQNPNKTGRKKNALVFKDRQRRIAKRLLALNNQ